jgi:uncharacterized protein YlxP (DUF503 family)
VHRCGQRDDRQRAALHVGVVGHEVQNNRRVLRRVCGVVDSDRCIIDRIDGQADRRGVGRGGLAVADSVGEAVRTGEVGIRCVGHRPVDVQHGAAVHRCGQRDNGQRVVLHVGVVGHEVQNNRRVFRRVRAIVDSDRRIIDRIDGQADRRGVGRGGLAVADAVGETVRTGEVGIRGVSHRAVGVQDCAAVHRCGQRDNGQCAAVYVGVVGQDLQNDRRVFRCGGGFVHCHRRVVDCPHLDRNSGWAR